MFASSSITRTRMPIRTAPSPDGVDARRSFGRGIPPLKVFPRGPPDSGRGGSPVRRNLPFPYVGLTAARYDPSRPRGPGDRPNVAELKRCQDRRTVSPRNGAGCVRVVAVPAVPLAVAMVVPAGLGWFWVKDNPANGSQRRTLSRRGSAAARSRAWRWSARGPAASRGRRSSRARSTRSSRWTSTPWSRAT